jgi:hypothetical protein
MCERKHNLLAFKRLPAIMKMRRARVAPCARQAWQQRLRTTLHAPRHASVRENIMVRTELRVVLAVIATFVVLAGIGVAIHGLLFDQSRALFFGAVAIVVGATTTAISLNVWPNDQT